MRVRGHTLLSEGAAFTAKGYRHGCTGAGRCMCGAASPILPSDNARKAWHREHKQAVLDQRGPVATCLGCDPPGGFPTFEDAQRHARAEGHGRIEISTEARTR